MAVLPAQRGDHGRPSERPALHRHDSVSVFLRCRNDGGPDVVVITDHDGGECEPSSYGGIARKERLAMLRRICLTVLLVAALLVSMSWLSGRAQGVSPSKRAFCNGLTADGVDGARTTTTTLVPPSPVLD